MGWEGDAVFEELVDGRWIVRAEVEIRALVYRAGGAIHAPFVTLTHEDEEYCQYEGFFMWEDFVTESNACNDIGSYRPFDKMVEEIFDRGHQELAMLLRESPNQFRVTFGICH